MSKILKELGLMDNPPWLEQTKAKIKVPNP